MLWISSFDLHESKNTPDQVKIPPIYHNLAEALNKQRVLSSQPHRPYYCPLDLLPGAPLLSSRLYNLSIPEKETQDVYWRILCFRHYPFLYFPCNSNFFGGEKKNKIIRPCIEYHGLNQITLKINTLYHILIQCMNSCILLKYIYINLYLRNAYHLVRIKDRDEWENCF